MESFFGGVTPLIFDQCGQNFNARGAKFCGPWQIFGWEIMRFTKFNLGVVDHMKGGFDLFIEYDGRRSWSYPAAVTCEQGFGS